MLHLQVEEIKGTGEMDPAVSRVPAHSQKASRTSGCDEGFHGRLQEVQEQSPGQNGHGVDANPPARVDSTGF